MVHSPQRSSDLIWFLLCDSDGKPYKESSVSAVSLPPTFVVDQFRDAVLLKNSPILPDIASSQLKVYRNKIAFDKRNDKEQVEMEPLKSSQLLDGLGKTEDGALVVLVPSSTSPSVKAFRQRRYKAMSVEASCRKYLDAIASRLAEFYEFDYRFKSGATIGDVLAAKDGTEGIDWDIRRAKKTYQRFDGDGFTTEVEKGQPLTSTKLPDVYTAEEWNIISKFNENITERVHNASLPSLPNGRPYIVIPHSEFTPEMIAFLKILALRLHFTNF